jgi:hypothetical protein
MTDIEVPARQTLLERQRDRVGIAEARSRLVLMAQFTGGDSS